VAWPHEPAVVDFHASEGRSWRLSLNADGARSTPAVAKGEDPVDADLRGTAGELVLVFYSRIPMDSLKLDGDRRHFDRLVEWDPSE
jgi:hypothetical protein